ncbi:MAG: HD domain-containing protein [Proteobacteria bacterium]|nr:MAG: HD domain-containing protein [Pseudomonadota bacterium]
MIKEANMSRKRGSHKDLNPSRSAGLLSSADDPKDRIRDPIHGFIRFSPNERQVIDHPLFRRLRHIRQLALTEYVYPGATHSRFGHSLGVMEIVTRMFDVLCAKNGSLMEDVFRKDSRFSDNPLATARQAVRVAALLHDTGHAPFSHAVEKFAHKDADHEHLSIQIASEHALLGGTLKSLWGEQMPTLVAQLLSGKDLPPQLLVLRHLVSSQLDGDRMDYLLRDSYYCGVEYGRFDHRRLIESLEVIGDENIGLEIAINRDGIHTLEAFVLARYQLFTQVLYHRVRRIYDGYLLDYFKALGEEAPKTPEAVLATDDIQMTAKIMRDADGREDEAGKWARRICYRKHHRMVFETGMSASANDLRAFKHAREALEKKYTDVYNDEAIGAIHKLELPSDTEERQGVPLRVVRPSGPPRLATEESNILRGMQRNFACGRLFLDLDDKKARTDANKIAETAYIEAGGR